MTGDADVVFEFGVLEGVRLRDLDETITTAEFFFSQGTLAVSANPETDTIETTATPGAPSLPNDLGSGPWAPAIGCSLLWIWRLTNHQGYEDGIQMEFRTADGYFQMQLMVAASTFTWQLLTDATPNST